MEKSAGILQRIDIFCHNMITTQARVSKKPLEISLIILDRILSNKYELSVGGLLGRYLPADRLFLIYKEKHKYGEELIVGAFQEKRLFLQKQLEEEQRKQEERKKYLEQVNAVWAPLLRKKDVRDEKESFVAKEEEKRTTKRVHFADSPSVHGSV